MTTLFWLALQVLYIINTVAVVMSVTEWYWFRVLTLWILFTFLMLFSEPWWHEKTPVVGIATK